MRTVLVADKLPQSTIEILSQAGFEVDNRPGLSPDELREALREPVGVICRSGAELSEEALSGAENLRAICRAGVGVDNIDIDAASHRGVVVMNTPGANTISTAEHTFALILALSRNIAPAYISMRQGRWERRRFTGAQLAGTTVGIVGLGRVGQAVAARAKAFRMKVVGQDPYISRKTASKLGVQLAESIDEVLEQCDYLTVHVPVNEETSGLIGTEQINRMKPSARLVNCARGAVVDQDAVVEAVRDGRLAGAAFDVYTDEPPASYEFAQDDRILATPHLGASTQAAQEAVGAQAANQLIDALTEGHFRNALNITSVPPEEMDALRPLCELVRKMGKMAGYLNRGRPNAIIVACNGEVANGDVTPVINYGVMGVLQTALGENINIVSAPHLAEDRGIEVTGRSSTTSRDGFTSLVTLCLSTDEGEMNVSGTVLGQTHPRVVEVGGFNTEIEPEGDLLVLFAPDKPGVVGRVGDVLGDAGINIAQMTFGRQEAGGDALLALKLDNPCRKDTLEQLRELPIVNKAVLISL